LTVKIRVTALIILFILSSVDLMAQTGTTPESDTSHWPGWLRDLRRWEIVAFGSFPFTMFFSTIGMNTYRWHRETGMDWGRREYAPWPLTSAGAIPMEDSEQRRTIMIAIGLSAGVAVADHLIVQARRRRERRRAEAIPVGTVIITRMPIEEPYEEQDDAMPYDDLAYDDGPVADTGDAEAATP